jgi:hypothetical protein
MDAPKSPPPDFIPEKDKALALGFTKTPGVDVVLPSTVVPCMFKFTYIWTKNKAAFWAKPIKLSKDSLSCWNWTGSAWVSREIPLKNIDSFICEYF